MMQGKIERFHLSMKSVVKLDNYYLPGQLEEAIAGFITYYNEARYREALNNVTPADMYHGRAAKILARRAQIKADTMRERRRLHRHASESLLL